MAKKQRIKVPSILAKRVFAEARARCPFCDERDQAALEIHHLDGSPANNALQNLLLVCSSCHRKIEAGVISEKEVCEKKATVGQQQKFDPQLYQPRSAIRQATQKLINDAVSEPRAENLSSFYRATSDAGYLFEPDDVGSFLNEVEHKVNTVITVVQKADRLPAGPEHSALRIREGDLKQELLRDLSKLDIVFSPYLKATG